MIAMIRVLVMHCLHIVFVMSGWRTFVLVLMRMVMMLISILIGLSGIFCVHGLRPFSVIQISVQPYPWQFKSCPFML